MMAFMKGQLKEEIIPLQYLFSQFCLFEHTCTLVVVECGKFQGTKSSGFRNIIFR